MNCLIIDDNALASLTLKQLASGIPNLHIIAECNSAMSALKYLQKEEVDLLFLDIEMPGMTGIELVKSLTQRPIIIFTTSEKKYAAEAFELCVADYLIKPINLPRLLQAVTKAEEISRNKNSTVSNVARDFIFIKENKVLRKISVDKISWIEAMGDYVKFRVDGKYHIVHSTLKQLEEKLDPRLFFRVHRSYIAAIQKIESIEENALNISGAVIPIAENYRAPLLKKINLI